MSAVAVLILTYDDDAHAERLRVELQKLGAQAVLLSRSEILKYEFEIDGDRLAFRSPSTKFDIADITSVFVRSLPKAANFGSEDSAIDVSEKGYIGLQKESLFFDWLHTLPLRVPVINDFAAVARSNGKIFQSQVAKSVGLLCPNQYVGSDPSKARAFVQRTWAANAEVCTKSLSNKYVVVNGERFTRYTEKFPRSDLPALGTLADCPLIFQNYVEKAYELRVTVIDRQIFACRIDSQEAGGDTSLDWRKYNIPRTPHSAYKLPPAIEDGIFRFHEAAGLRFSAFDFIRTKTGEYVFLETNAFGQWLWIEDLTGMPITATLAATLAHPKHLHRQD